MEITVFDDSAPLENVPRGGMAEGPPDEGDEGKIGTARIRLVDLAQGNSIYGDFVVKDDREREAGVLSVRISISDAASDAVLRAGETTGVGYSNAWDNDMLQKIAAKLAEYHTDDMETVFTYFAAGEGVITRERFKSSVLQQLGMQIGEKEVDVFVRSSKLFGGANYVEKGQFMRVMGPFFTAARKQNNGGDFYGTDRKSVV